MQNKIEPTFIPKRSTLDSCGYDVYVPDFEWVITTEYQTFDTGVYFDGKEIPFDRSDIPWFGLIVPRSSMGFKHGLKFSNTVCIIDKDYRDTIKVRMKADHNFKLDYGSRFAQLIFVPFGILKGEVKPTSKRDGGIGSTDNKIQKTLEGII